MYAEKLEVDPFVEFNGFSPPLNDGGRLLLT